MSPSPRTPKILKGGIILLNPQTNNVDRIITFQYNSNSLTRSLQAQDAGEGGDRSEALRLTGPPIETYNLEAEIDATDQLEVVDSVAVEEGIQPIMNAFETIIYPSSTQLFANNALANAGTLEITPIEAPLTLFVWGKRVYKTEWTFPTTDQ